MSSIWLVIIVVLLTGLVFLLFKSRRREVERPEFEHCIRWFLQTKKDGARLTFSHPRTSFAVDLFRQNEIDEACEISVQLRAPSWSDWFDPLQVQLDCQLFEPRIEVRNGKKFLELTIAVHDFSAPEAGARAARALALIFDAAGIGSGERFEVKSQGANSVRLWRPAAERWVDERNPVLRKLGKSTLRRLKEEAEERHRKRNGEDSRDGRRS